MDELTFEDWWKEFLSLDRVRFEKNSYDTIRELKGYSAKLEPSQREVFVDELATIAIDRTEGHELAVYSLEGACTPRVLSRIERHAAQLRGSTRLENQSALSQFVRLLTESSHADQRAFVRSYLLVDPITIGWSSVPWKLWPEDPDLFAHSWSRYFVETSSDEWGHTAIVSAFLSRPDPLACVRAVLEVAHGDVWIQLRGAVEAQLSKHQLSDAERDAVRLVCGAAE